MKRLLTILLALFTLSIHAQTSKGSFMVGGDASLNFNNGDSDNSTSSKSTSLILNPTAGYFFVNNFSAGLSIPFDVSWSTTKISSLPSEYDGNGHSLGIAPFVRYYIPVKSFFIITHAGYGWYSSKTSYEYIDVMTGAVIGTNEYKNKYRTLTLAAGPTFILSPHTAIEILANYQRSTFSADYSAFDQSKFYISVGFQIYLPSNKE